MKSGKKEQKINAVSPKGLSNLWQTPGLRDLVFDKLPVKDLSQASAVSKNFNKLTNQQNIWKNLYQNLILATGRKVDFLPMQQIFNYKSEYLKLLKQEEELSFIKYWSLPNSNYELIRHFFNSAPSELLAETSSIALKEWLEVYEKNIRNFVQLKLFIKSFTPDSFKGKATQSELKLSAKYSPIDNILFSQYKFSFDLFYDQSFNLRSEIEEIIIATNNQLLFNFVYSLAKARYKDISKSDEYGRSLLYWAIIFNQPITEINRLLGLASRDKLGEPLKTNSQNLLHVAAQGCATPKIVERLLLESKHINPNNTDSLGRTPLLLTVKSKDPDSLNKFELIFNHILGSCKDEFEKNNFLYNQYDIREFFADRPDGIMVNYSLLSYCRERPDIFKFLLPMYLPKDHTLQQKEEFCQKILDNGWVTILHLIKDQHLANLWHEHLSSNPSSALQQDSSFSPGFFSKKEEKKGEKRKRAENEENSLDDDNDATMTDDSAYKKPYDVSSARK